MTNWRQPTDEPQAAGWYRVRRIDEEPRIVSPTFAAGAGEYILIHRKDWDQFKMDLRMAFGPTTPDVVGYTNADQPDGAA